MVIGLDEALPSMRNLVLIGTPASQPLLSEWQGSMPLSLSTDGMHVNQTPAPSRILHPEIPFRDRDWSRLSKLLADGARPDLVVEDFVSPLRPDRSVVTIVYLNRPDAIARLFVPGSRQGPVYGGVSVSQNGSFQSFLVGSQTYHSGHLDSYQRATVFAFENYGLIPFAVVLLAFVVGAWLYRSTEGIAARRLAAGGI